MTLATAQAPAHPAINALRTGWKIYAIDGALLGCFMISACAFVALLEHPGSPVRHAVGSSFTRRALVGIAMSLTALCLIYSPWGRRSGPHLNPAMTLSFLRLGRISVWDAMFYILAQFFGATLGVLISATAMGMIVSHPAVNYAATVPGTSLPAAWTGEFCVAFVTMAVVMTSNKYPRLAPLTGLFAAALVAVYITFEAPISGMSSNPARTFGSAVFAHTWHGLWIYFTAPVAGMFAGIELHRAFTRQHQKLCGKLTHSRTIACYIECDCLKEGRS